MHLVFMIYSWDRTFIYVSLEIHGHKIFYPFFFQKREYSLWPMVTFIKVCSDLHMVDTKVVLCNITTDRLVNKSQIISPKILEAKYYRMGKV